MLANGVALARAAPGAPGTHRRHSLGLERASMAALASCGVPLGCAGLVAAESTAAAGAQYLAGLAFDRTAAHGPGPVSDARLWRRAADAALARTHCACREPVNRCRREGCRESPVFACGEDHW